MTQRTRGILMGVLSVVFLITAPLVVGYSIGHRIDRNTQDPISVGAMLIRTFPRNALVTLNDGEYQRTSPGAFRSLREGEYIVRIEKEGYRPWEKRINIQGTRISDIRHVRLVSEYVEEELVKRNINEFSISSNEQYIIATEYSDTDKRVIFAQTANTELPETWNRTDLSFSKDAEVGFLWGPDTNNVLIVKKIEHAIDSFYVFNIATETYIPLPYADDVLGWLPGNASRIIIQKGNTLFHERPGEEVSRVRIVDGVKNATLYVGGIIAEIEENNERGLYRIPRGTGTPEIITTPSFDGDHIGSFHPSSYGDIALVLEPSSSLILWNNSHRTWISLADNVSDVWWSPDGEKLLWQETEFDLYVANIREKRTVLQPFMPELITRTSSPIIKPTWFAGSQHVLYRLQGDLYITEIDPRDRQRAEKLLETHIHKADSRVVEGGEVIYTTAIRQDGSVLLRIYLYTESDR